MSFIRSDRDEAIVETLVFKVRLLTLPMVAETWWQTAAAPSAHARRRLMPHEGQRDEAHRQPPQQQDYGQQESADVHVELKLHLPELPEIGLLDHNGR